jgi:GR25 family glycosyltransferase involved in LPS biosynthesis
MSVELDMANPNLVVFGPFRKGDEQRYPGVPKVFFTGENSGPNTHPDTFLNLGFRYDMGPSYIRLPLWVLEINWWGADPEKIQNPKPVPLADCLTVKPELLDRKQKFCAFVATNPCNSTRNEAFQILNRWRPVDSAGRLFCNRAEGPIAGGMGGGGGELSKVDYYKDYQFALTFENSSAPGYTTEKLFHAKVAGCVPIYWGDAFVDRDFDARGFINANQLGTAQGFIDLVAKVVNDPHEWRKMASVPALSATKKKWCEQTMESVGKAIFQRILGTDVQVQWAHALSFGGAYEGLQAPVQMPVQVASQFTPQVSSQAPVQVASHFTPQAPVQAPIQAPIQAPSHVLTNDGSKTIVLATNANYIESAVNLLGSCAKEQCTKVVYVWPDVKLGDHTLLMKHGATEIRTFPCATEQPWQDFWEPKHFAWKLWLLSDAHAKAEAGAKLLYLDAGIVIAKNLSNIWSWIEEKGCFLINDPTQLNERWCHPKFCSAMNVLPQELKKTQLWAGCVGFAKGGVFDSILLDAFDWAKNRDVIVGNKWQPYSTVCMGHRHDQSILSILTDRRGLPRALLDDHYCDRSMRATLQHGVSFYVHRGTYRDFVPFVDKIDEAYVINLERRDDRKKRFIASHTNISERVYLWKAVDGRSLSLRPEITHLFRQNDFSWKKSVMGCALSHYSLWQKLATDPLAKSYLILEDDVVLEERWLLKWVQASNFFPADADVVYLGGVLPPNKGVFPTIVDPVNPHFAKVKPNAVFGGSLRRYFHFCNYAYILTQQGARKLCSLIQDRGIFTSGDHMIVNHGDSLLNIYFTTPLLATCYQEQDPVYQTSQFNNFSRIDNFDSDLWNNDDRFSMEEVQKCQPNAAPLASANTSSHEDHILVWNAFLRHISQNQRSEITKSIDAVFAIWKHQSLEEFQTNIGWFRVFEQLIQAKQPALLEHAQHIRARITGLVSAIPSSVWSNILSALPSQTEATDTIRIFHMNEVNPQGLMEHAWLQSIFPKPLSWTPLASAQSLQGCANPVVLYMNLPGRNDYVRNALQSILHELEASGTQVTMLHLSDEFHTDKIDIYGSKAVKQVLRTYWRKDLAQYGEKVYVIPLGYAKGASNAKSVLPTYSERPLMWSFAGSLDRPGREQSLATLRAIQPYKECSKPSWGSPNRVEGPDYTNLLETTKFVPCFRGSLALESFRLYETLESGAIPIYVPSESSTNGDEYRELFGQHPLLGFPSWEKAVEVLPKLASQTELMEKHRRSIQDWWLTKKETVRAKLANMFH